MLLWGTLVCIFYVLEFTVIHTLDNTGPEIPTPESKGELNIAPRIFGGKKAFAGQFPYQVLIYYWKGSEEFMCGGAIISDHHILTAAHCVSNFSKIDILAGNIDRNTTENWIHASVSEVYVHEDFLPEFYYNDVAVIKLKERFSLDGKVTASLKLSDTEVSSGEMCRVTGWGETKDESDSTILRYVDLPIVDRNTCSKQLEEKLRPGEICAGQTSGGKDSCAGDSGGPLVCNGYLTGIVSWGVECALPNKPGVYTNVVWYKDWIEKRTATVSQENSNLVERNSKNTETGFTSVIFGLSFISLLRYLIQ